MTCLPFLRQKYADKKLNEQEAQLIILANWKGQ